MNYFFNLNKDVNKIITFFPLYRQIIKISQPSCLTFEAPMIINCIFSDNILFELTHLF